MKLWQSCNNKCSFCNQRLGSVKNDFGLYINPSKDSIIKHTNILVDNIDENKDNLVTIMGGELFHCPLLVDLYSGFDYLAANINTYLKKSEVIIFSNLLYSDITLFLYVWNKLKNNKNVFFKTSFDFIGRFSSNSQVDLFCENIKKLDNIGINLPVKSVITLNTINMFNKDLYTYKKFNEICNYFTEINFEEFKTHCIDNDTIIDRFKVTDFYKNMFFDIIKNSKWKFTYKDNKFKTNVNFIINGKIIKDI